MREAVPTILVDRSTLFREGLARVLSRSRFRIVGAFSSVPEVPDCSHGQGDALLFVIEAAHGEMRSIKQGYPEARLVVLADLLKFESLKAALQCGADGYLEKTICCEALVKSLELVMLGDFVVSRAAIPLLTQLAIGPENRCKAVESTPARPCKQRPSLQQTSTLLSAREVEVVKCLTEGASNKEIARTFDITEAIVRVHVRDILRKLQAKNRTQAAIWANAHLSGSAIDPVEAGGCTLEDRSM
jgi:two-component system, NarL family, nitrate/nitrite response regulator NarL